MKFAFRCAVWIGILFAANIIHAQLDTNDLAAIESGTPMSADEVPPIGLFFSAYDPDAAPAPGNFYNVPVWSLDTNGDYLLNDLGGGFHAMDERSPVDGFTNEDGYITNYFSYSPPTNGLWLQVSNVADGNMYMNLNGATDCVYAVLSSQSLGAGTTFSNWDIETEVFGSSTNPVPFYVSMNGRNALFLSARDWTGITNNGNTTPEWWFYFWFGIVDLSDSDLDSSGNTLYYDYTQKLNPNIILFSLQFTNNYFTANPAVGTIAIAGGMPFYEAILVNNTNYGDAVWVPYTSTNLEIDLSSNGIYNIYVGLRGLHPDAAPTWSETQLILNSVLPTITITSPASNTVSQPLIQLQGLVNESLNNMTFDVSNALGIVTNQEANWEPAFFDANVATFTTNTFTCSDVQLATGMNTVTLHVTDTEGNTTETNVSFTLDYSFNTNPPALSILWPQNGTAISGNNFTLEAQVDDNTATVMAQITDTNGDTATVQGLVERSGLVLANNLPLAVGTNYLTIAATNAGGYGVVTNLTIVQSALTVTVDPLSEANQTSVTVTGTVSDPGADVWVNGVEATIVDDAGDWGVSGVPVSATGTASVDVKTYSDDSDSDLVGEQIANTPQTPVVAMMSYQKSVYQTQISYGLCSQGTAFGTGSELINWTYQSGGYYNSEGSDNLNGDCVPDSDSSSQYYPGGYNAYSATWEDNESSENYVSTGNIYGSDSTSSRVHTDVMVAPSDQAAVGQQALYLVSVQVFDENTGNQLPGSSLQFEHQVPGTPTVDTTDGSGTVWSQFLAEGPAGVNLIVSPLHGGDISFNPSWPITPVTLQIVDNNNGNVLSGQTNTVIVGQQMNLNCQLNITNAALGLTNSMLSNFQWTVPGYAISNYVVAPDASSASVATSFPTNNLVAKFYWVDGASNRIVQCSATINGLTVSGQAVFNVLKPDIDWTGSITGAVAVDTNYWDSFLIFGLWNNTWLHFGDSLNTSGSIIHGITFTETNVSLNGCTGEYNALLCVQIATSTQTEHCRTNGISSHTTSVGLDTKFPYSVLNDDLEDINSTLTSDAPGVFCSPNDDNVSDSDSFQMFLMFQPQNTNSIPIPLKVINWNWAGSATYGPPWDLVSSNVAITANNTETVEFPQWTQNVTNYLTITNNICN